jgi:hypothetical protein
MHTGRRSVEDRAVRTCCLLPSAIGGRHWAALNAGGHDSSVLSRRFFSFFFFCCVVLLLLLLFVVSLSLSEFSGIVVFLFLLKYVTLLWFLLCIQSGIRTLRICSLCCYK